MLRLAGFFVGVLLILNLLRALLGDVPVLGWVLGIPILGFWLVAIGLAALVSRLSAEALDHRKRRGLVRQLGAVDTPHNMGKLGSLLLAQGRARRALPYLERACEGEGEVAEWHYRRGLALLELGRPGEARAALERTLAIDEEHGYGGAMMGLARIQARAGDHARALEVLARYERNHGPRPESAYRRGVSLKALGRRGEARAAFDEVADLSRTSARYQRKGNTGWVLRAFLARMG